MAVVVRIPTPLRTLTKGNAEVQAKADTADLASMRATLGTLNLGDVQLQQFGTPKDVLIRIGQQPGGEGAQQQAVQRVRQALGDQVEYRRVEVVVYEALKKLAKRGTVRQTGQGLKMVRFRLAGEA